MDEPGSREGAEAGRVAAREAGPADVVRETEADSQAGPEDAVSGAPEATEVG